MFVYLPNTSHFIHFQLVRQKIPRLLIIGALQVKASLDDDVRGNFHKQKECNIASLILIM